MKAGSVKKGDTSCGAGRRAAYDGASPLGALHILHLLDVLDSLSSLTLHLTTYYIGLPLQDRMDAPRLQHVQDSKCAKGDPARVIRVR